MKMSDLGPEKIFHFVRGAIRSAYGIEDFRGKHYLLVGNSDLARDFLHRISSLTDITVSFQNLSLTGYSDAMVALCGRLMGPYNGKADVVIDFDKEEIEIKGKPFPMKSIGEDPYNQGIHEYYL